MKAQMFFDETCLVVRINNFVDSRDPKRLTWRLTCAVDMPSFFAAAVKLEVSATATNSLIPSQLYILSFT